MFAFPAAKRTILLMMSIALLTSVTVAQAGDDQAKGYLGVMLQDLTPSMAKALQMGDRSGVMVNEVVDDSPAEKAGLEDGDVILEFDGKTASDYLDLTKAVRGTSPGDKVEVVVLRNGKNKALTVEIGEHETQNVFFKSGDDDEDFTWTTGENMVFDFDGDRGYMGVQLDDLNRQLGEYFGVEDGKGALVTEVVEDSPAAKAGLKAGDVIVKAGGKDVDASASLREALSDTEPGQQMDIKVVRKGKSKDLSVTLGEMPADDFAKQIKVFRDRDDRFSIPRAPRMMKRLGNHGDRAQSELKEMREELDKMREELQAMKKELKK